MREYVWLEWTTCGDRNYRTQKETRGAERLELKKYCRKERKHTPHKESRRSEAIESKRPRGRASGRRSVETGPSVGDGLSRRKVEVRSWIRA